MATTVTSPASALAAAGIVGEWAVDAEGWTGMLDAVGARFVHGSEELAGVWVPILEGLDLIHEDDREGVLAYCKKILATGGPTLVEFRLNKEGGLYRWVQLRGYLAWDERGRMMGRGVIIDTTDFHLPAAHFPAPASQRADQRHLVHDDPLEEAAALGIEVRTALGRSGHGALRLAADLLLFEINTALAARTTVSGKPGPTPK